VIKMEPENDVRKAVADSLWEDRDNGKNHIQKAVEESLKKDLENDIRKFLAENIHSANYGKPFELAELRCQYHPRHEAIEVRLKGVEEQDLHDNDPVWHARLREVGFKYNVLLSIPLWYYEK
jgi:hypothetical protein